MGKWSKLKSTMTRFVQPETWQQKIDKVKLELKSKNRIDLCKELTFLWSEKDKIKEKLAELNTREEAICQIMVDQLEGEEEISFKNPFGTFFLKDDPYCTIENKNDYLAWIEQQGLHDILTVNYQTMAGMTKTRLENGEELPPGIKVFMKTSIGHRKPND